MHGLKMVLFFRPILWDKFSWTVVWWVSQKLENISFCTKTKWFCIILMMSIRVHWFPFFICLRKQFCLTQTTSNFNQEIISNGKWIATKWSNYLIASDSTQFKLQTVPIRKVLNIILANLFVGKLCCFYFTHLQYYPGLLLLLLESRILFGFVPFLF